MLLDFLIAGPLAGGTPATPLGLDPHPAVERVALGPADRLLLYTDGLVEARDGHGRPFEVDDRAAAELLAAPSLDQALDRLVASVLRHAGGSLDDDLALVLAQPRRLVLRRAASAARSAPARLSPWATRRARASASTAS